MGDDGRSTIAIISDIIPSLKHMPYLIDCG